MTVAVGHPKHRHVVKLGQGLSDSISCDCLGPKSNHDRNDYHISARIISRSPAAGSAKFKSLRSIPNEGGKGSWTFCHKRMTPTRRASTVPKAAPTMPQPKGKWLQRRTERLIDWSTGSHTWEYVDCWPPEPRSQRSSSSLKRTMVPPTRKVKSPTFGYCGFQSPTVKSSGVQITAEAPPGRALNNKVTFGDSVAW